MWVPGMTGDPGDDALFDLTLRALESMVHSDRLYSQIDAAFPLGLLMSGSCWHYTCRLSIAIRLHRGTGNSCACCCGSQNATTVCREYTQVRHFPQSLLLLDVKSQGE